MASLFLTLPAHADEFSGTWTGKGTMDSQDRQQAIAAQFTLTVNVAADHLQIKECWDTGENIPGSKDCMMSNYPVKVGDIYSDNRKIGDIYPDYITTLDSNSQVSEQMILNVEGGGASMLFEYNYMNLDGNSDHHKVLLTKAP